MTDGPMLNPQILGRAENAHRAVLGRILAGTGIGYRHWVAISMAASSSRADGRIDRDELIDRLVDALRADRKAIAAVLAELAGMGFLAAGPDDQWVGLTEAGRAVHRDTRAAIEEVIDRMYGDIPAADLATAGRILALVTERASTELAAGPRVTQ
jgi:hypothetical protein